MKVSIFLMAICIAVAVAQEEVAKCPHVQLQNDVDLRMIDGKWRQIFYTPGTFYNAAICYHLHIESQNFSGNGIKLTYHFATKQPNSKDDFLGAQTDINAGVGEEHDHQDGGKHELHLFKNHIATDYSRYLILYTCDEETGQQIFDIQIRKEKRVLGLGARAGINAVLNEFGLQLRDLTRVRKRQCPDD